MFSHHILKPERMPIEANVWGTPKSSGSFSTLFRMRMQRAIDYREAPFEVKLTGSGKTFQASPPFSGVLEKEWPVQGNYKPRGIYLSCASSDETELPTESIDFVVTDPPFFDNVHYSELADFFLAWQSLKPHGFIANRVTTRHPKEVQDANEEEFTQKLIEVFAECNRILKQTGLLIFTYHHSRTAGWIAVSKALVDAGFSVVNAHPIKAELSLATPKAQAAEPIQLDIVFVCKKQEFDARPLQDPDIAFSQAQHRSRSKLARLAACGLNLSYNDRKITLLGQFIALLGPITSSVMVQTYLTAIEDRIDNAARMPESQAGLATTHANVDDALPIEQLTFSFAD